MKLSFRWYGEDDKVTLQNIRQIPGMHSVVTAVYDVPVGEVWSRESIAKLKKQTEDAGLHFEVIEKGERESVNNTEHTLIVAINYGGRQEIVDTVNRLIKDGKEITVESISQNLYTAPFGEPDLIIRTGGELRTSNFLVYQGAYSELYFTDVLWPDFGGNEFDKALDAFALRKRRFGKVVEE